MKKALISLGLIVVMVFSLTACGSGSEAKTYNIGICQLVQHEALDAATKGFKDALIDEFGEDSLNFDEQNAQGEPATCATITNGFAQNEYDLILANATAALTAASQATDSIPVLGTSVTDYASALNLKNFDGTVGTNVSGTTDLAPLADQAKMLNELFPNAKTVSILYCSAEANSQYQADVMKKELEGMNYEVKFFSFSDTNDLSGVAGKAAEYADVIYVPTDNAVASNTAIIQDASMNSKTPVVAGEEGICAGCGVATLSISYYDLGVATGKMAVKILKGEEKVEEMPVESAPDFTKKYNAKNAKALGVEIPDGYEEIVTE